MLLGESIFLIISNVLFFSNEISSSSNEASHTSCPRWMLAQVLEIQMGMLKYQVTSILADV